MRTMERLPVACLCLLLSCSAVGVAAKTSVKTVHQTNDQALLQCEVKGASPKPEVEWRDSSGNILPAEEPLVSERGNYSDIIVNITVTKTDTYHCVATQKEINLQTEAHTYVYISGSAGSRVEVKEDSDVILPCSHNTKEDIRSKLFDWRKDRQGKDFTKDVFLYDAGIYYDNGRSGQHEQFRGRVFHFPDELQHGNASIIIRKTKVADSGNYTCDFPNLQTPQTFPIELVVAPILKDRSAENIPGASPEPYVTIFKRENGVLLQCKVKEASPKPKVEWRDSSGNILPAEEPLVSERGGSFNITINITVTKTDTYHCVSTQKEIYHKIEAEIYVPLNGAASKPYVTILEQKKDQALLECEVQGGSPKTKVEWKDNSGNILRAKETQVTERGGSFDIILQATVTKTDRYRCVATQKEINYRTASEIHVLISEPNSGAEPGSGSTWLVFVAVLLAVFYTQGCITVNC